jgi:hypothetical protein
VEEVGAPQEEGTEEPTEDREEEEEGTAEAVPEPEETKLGTVLDQAEHAAESKPLHSLSQL